MCELGDIHSWLVEDTDTNIEESLENFGLTRSTHNNFNTCHCIVECIRLKSSMVVWVWTIFTSMMIDVNHLKDSYLKLTWSTISI